MWPFTSAQQKSDETYIAGLEAENDQLLADKKRALADLGRTAIQRDEATDRVAQLEREIDGLSIALRAAESQLGETRAQLQPFLDRRAKAKLNLRQFRKPANGAAAQAVV